MIAVKLVEHETRWGPFDSFIDADNFAEFVTQEIDPAEVERDCSHHPWELLSPLKELLHWRINLIKRRTEGGE